jgi:hypothetical protein
MAKGKGKKKALNKAPAVRPTCCPLKPMASDLVGCTSTPGQARLRPASFENQDDSEEDDMYVDEERERSYIRQEEQEDQEEQDTSDSGSESENSGASLLPPPPPLKIIIPQKRNKQPKPRQLNSKCIHCIFTLY